MMTKIKSMTYIKDNGDYSKRQVIVISKPRENYLVIDVSKLTEIETDTLLALIEDSDTYRNENISEFEVITDIKYNSLWRSFKPSGIEWGED